MALLLGPVLDITLETIIKKDTYSLGKWKKIFQEDILACKCFSFIQYFVNRNELWSGKRHSFFVRKVIEL